MDPVEPTRHEPVGNPGASERRSLIWSMVGLGMLVAICFIGAWVLRQVSDSDYWVDHTREVISDNQRLLTDIQEAESAERGYIITGDQDYLTPFRLAGQDIPVRLQKLKQLVADNPAQQQRLVALEPLISQRLAVLDTAVRLRRDASLAAAQKAVVAGHGLALMEQIRDASRTFEAEETRLLRERSQRRQSRLRNGFIVVLGASVLALVALLSAPFDVRRALRQRDVAARAREESESTAHALFQAAAQAIFIVDETGSIIMANPAASSMLGYAPDELIGHSVELFVPDRLRTGHIAQRKSYFAHPEHRPMGLGRDLQARRKDGSEFPAEISLSYIQTVRGTLAVAFVTDISKRKADEEAIRRQREDLRHLAGQLMTAQDDERRRIARDLHDDLSQRLAFLSMDIGKFAAKLPSPELATDIRALQSRAHEASDIVRRISHQLHPSVLDDIGLDAALEQYCDEFEHRTGISTQFTASNIPESLQPEVARSIFHIAQECLRNVSKHAETETVEVALQFSEGTLRLIVRDQGIGLSPKQRENASRGIGLVAMKERASLVNGKLSIQSEQGEGTEVRVEVPLAANA